MKKGKEKWQGLVSEQAASGKSVAGFCREKGLSDKLFYLWRKKLEGQKEEARFIQVGAPRGVELELEEGLKLRCTVESLGAVIDVLCR